MSGAQSILGVAVKGIASGIGLASEGIRHHKEKKQKAKESENADLSNNIESSLSEYAPGQNDEDLLEENDDEYWALDEAQEEITPEESPAEAEVVKKENLRERDVPKIIDAFVQKHPLTPEQLAAITKLPLPVILPQRRPKDRTRGFIRAYAPVLENSAIDQQTFIDFLKTFERATKASPWINVINFAGIAGFFVPSLTAMAINAAIYITIKTAKAVQTRTRGNEFLDQANNKFFRPRGLYCLVMTWNPDADSTEEKLDIDSTISSSLIHSNSGKIHKVAHNLRRSDGKTTNQAIPETAPLIFPELDNLADQTGEEAVKKQNKLKRSANFAANYFDQRASAKHAAKHPDSVLAQGPKPKFTSRYADPTHPASSGNIISLVTGGHINPPSLLDLRGGRLGYGRGEAGRDGAYDGMGRMEMGRGYGRGLGEGLGGSIGGLGLGGPQGVKKLLKKNVMYLMVVPMPSEEEMAAAHAATQQSA